MLVPFGTDGQRIHERGTFPRLVATVLPAQPMHGDCRAELFDRIRQLGDHFLALLEAMRTAASADSSASLAAPSSRSWV